MSGTTRVVASIAAALLLAGGAATSVQDDAPTHQAAAAPAASATPAPAASATPAPAGCPRPAPTTAAGYKALWATLDEREWGGADVSISAPLPDGRVLWLYGDTFSAGPDGKGRFVHSTAIVQTGGCLHVANGGEQILPNAKGGKFTMDADAREIFWITGVEVSELGEVTIESRKTIVTDPKEHWGFKDGGYTQHWLTTVDENGDLVGMGVEPEDLPADSRYIAEAWEKATALGPPLDAEDGYGVPDPGPMVHLGEHHYGYSIRQHPWAQLDSGGTLTTMAQNYDDGKLRPLDAYQPLWFDGDPR